MASTLLFVHGTGVRGPALARTVELLRSKAAEFLPGWKIEACAWGDPFGAALNRHGASVPSYARTGDASASVAAQTRARWVLLADDPLIELRLAPSESVMGAPPGPDIWDRLLALADAATLPAELQAVLNDGGLALHWPEFIQSLATDLEWQTVVKGLVLSEAGASPLMARAVASALGAWLRERNLPGLDSSRRDALVDALVPPLGGPPAGLLDWMLHRLTAYGRHRRGSLTDLTSPAVGDILRYQARGDTLRDFIGIEARRTGAQALLAHSLGGIAAVDWLAMAPRGIDTLVTVGSQAAYFYEIDALASRAIGSGLPPHFPKRWLNIHDENDLLSYPAGGVFKGQVEDWPVDNGEPFPEAHSAYFHNRAQVWPRMADFLEGR